MKVPGVSSWSDHVDGTFASVNVGLNSTDVCVLNGAMLGRGAIEAGVEDGGDAVVVPPVVAPPVVVPPVVVPPVVVPPAVVVEADFGDLPFVEVA